MEDDFSKDEFRIIEDEDDKIAKNRMVKHVFELALEKRLQEAQKELVEDIIVDKIIAGDTDAKLSLSNELVVQLNFDKKGIEFFDFLNKSIYVYDEIELQDVWRSQYYEARTDEETGEQKVCPVVSYQAFVEILQTIIGEDDIPDNIEIENVFETLKTDMSARFPNFKEPVYPKLVLWKTVGNVVNSEEVKCELQIGNETEFKNMNLIDLNYSCLILNSVEGALREEQEYKVAKK